MSLFSRIKKSHDAKTVAMNFIFLALIKIAGLVTPLLVLPYLTRVIGTAYFGEISFAAAVIVFFETFADWGFNYTATRDVAINRENKTIVNHIFSEVLFGRIILMLVGLIILIVLTLIVPALSNTRLLLVLTFLYIPGNILFSEWVFQAFERMKYITYLNLTAKLLFTLLVFVVIKEKQDYYFQPLLYSGGFIVSGIWAQVIIRRQLGITVTIPKIKDIFKRIKASTDMFISLFLPNLYTNLTTVILKMTGGDVATGLYAGGQRLLAIIDSVTQTLSRAFFPYLTRHKEKHHIYVLISGAIAILACMAMFFGADLFVRIFLAPEFKESATVMKILAISPFFLFLMNTYGTNYLVVIGKENIMRNIILVCSIFGLIFSWIITVKFNYIGAAITLSTVWGIRGLLTYLAARKFQRIIQANK